MPAGMRCSYNVFSSFTHMVRIPSVSPDGTLHVTVPVMST